MKHEIKELELDHECNHVCDIIDCKERARWEIICKSCNDKTMLCFKHSVEYHKGRQLRLKKK